MKHHKLTEGKFHTNIKSMPTSSRPIRPPSGQNSKEKFEEEFEDEIHFIGFVDDMYSSECIELERSTFINLIEQYIGVEKTKIKIFCKKGKIVIEKIEE